MKYFVASLWIILSLSATCFARDLSNEMAIAASLADQKPGKCWKLKSRVPHLNAHDFAKVRAACWARQLGPKFVAKNPIYRHKKYQQTAEGARTSKEQEEIKKCDKKFGGHEVALRGGGTGTGGTVTVSCLCPIGFKKEGNSCQAICKEGERYEIDQNNRPQCVQVASVIPKEEPSQEPRPEPSPTPEREVASDCSNCHRETPTPDYAGLWRTTGSPFPQFNMDPYFLNSMPLDRPFGRSNLDANDIFNLTRNSPTGFVAVPLDAPESDQVDFSRIFQQ